MSQPEAETGTEMEMETVLFDLDGTLAEYPRSPEAVLADAFDRAGVDPFCDAAALWSLSDEVEDATDDRAFLTALFSLAATRHGGDPALGGTLARAYENAIDHTDVQFCRGAERALDLASRYRVGLVTNGSRRTQEQKLDALGIADAFETVVCADDVSAAKPDPEPFRAALADLGTVPDRGLYVGNSLTADVVGAKRVGLDVAWIPHEHDFEPEPAACAHRPDHRFETLEELDGLLAGC